MILMSAKLFIGLGVFLLGAFWLVSDYPDNGGN
jgi:hypothetical protein